MDRDRLQQIETDLRSKRIDVRKAALDLLATFDSDLAIPILQRLATEKDFGLRCLAMMGFNNYQTESSFEYLKSVLKEEKDHSVLAEAANSIYDFGEKAIAPLQDLFDDCEHWLVRQTVVAVLVESEDPQILLSIAQKAIQTSTQMTQETGIFALNKLLNTPFKQEAFDLFTQLASDRDWYIRYQTAIALRESQEPQARVILAKLQQDENYRVVAAALESKGVEGKGE
jgi:HEAT repeat protein